MSKNILILSGSPRKGGNSDILCDRFMEGARESGHRAEKVFLRDRNIGYCIGCEACHQNNGVCVQKDDMAEILGKMIAADVIVMATPVYFYTMDAQMKTLIDRCVARYTEISNKAFYFIATAAAENTRNTARYIICVKREDMRIAQPSFLRTKHMPAAAGPMCAPMTGQMFSADLSSSPARSPCIAEASSRHFSSVAE